MNRHRKAFTLIELLVVIAIIGILATITFFSFRIIRQRAYEAEIKTNLSYLSKLLEGYSAEHGDAYPKSNDVGICVEDLTSDSPTSSNIGISTVPLNRLSASANQFFKYCSELGNTYQISTPPDSNGICYIATPTGISVGHSVSASRCDDVPPRWYPIIVQRPGYAMVYYDVGPVVLIDSRNPNGTINVKATWSKAYDNLDLDNVNYELKYRKASSNDWLSIGSLNTNSTTINNLDDNSTYQFQVFAVDSSGNKIDGPVIPITFDFLGDLPDWTGFTAEIRADPIYTQNTIQVVINGTGTLRDNIQGFVAEMCAKNCDSPSNWTQKSFGSGWSGAQFNVYAANYQGKIYTIGTNGKKIFYPNNNSPTIFEFTILGKSDGDIIPPSFSFGSRCSGKCSLISIIKDGNAHKIVWREASDNVALLSYTIEIDDYTDPLSPVRLPVGVQDASRNYLSRDDLVSGTQYKIHITATDTSGNTQTVINGSGFLTAP